ncbi:WcaF family extracellular polysaccharide biosynthesis acetyltransferase [Synechococcus sp. PCC 6312]|uniref:WcaF family extracellular polysaccharide biosynthesis acetyltransferase n=1 Tax=Synechococcus sp. (strain ATCC 27167 / PCC 6312) TaxID=195253 RepID=UPI00029ED603|nr:WcaF family extracellular polysaccharide biosynthesis acetyltransferase [Synechococcus sp. PCC 6312]AFY59951.1 acetyltransferase (isoleucine patch superfamily) [Synechococcus sp. PCC 6312]
MSDTLTSNDPYTQPSFSLRNRLLRLIWNIFYQLLFRFSPRPLHEWRSQLLRLFGAKIGKHCHVYPSAKVWAPWNLVMEDYSGMADDVICYSMATIHLGKRVVISQGTYLCSGSHDYESRNFQLYAKPIYVGDQAWVCAQSFICPGVTIGEGAVVGARSVVTKDVPDWIVCAGNPCKSLKKRIIREY